MIVKIKSYFEKRKERKRISEQYVLEKKCVEYFDKSVPRWTSLMYKIIGGRTWESNPWVVAYSFELVD